MSRNPSSDGERYVKEVPSSQTQIRLFEGSWASEIPIDGTVSGSARLFDDVRVTWTAGLMGGLEGLRILELGPLEGFHTYQLERLGAKEVIAIESNVLAFQKCLVVKNLLDMRAKFLLGDFNAYLAEPGDDFDLIFASGVLYHMVDPAETIRMLCRRSDNLFLWTHFYDGAVVRESPFAGHFPAEGVSQREIDRLSVTYHARLYKEAVAWKGFCGGSEDHANWLTYDDIEALLNHFGFEVTAISDKRLDHPHGPAVCMFAQRQ